MTFSDRAVLIVLGGLASCGPAGLEPVELTERAGVESDVLSVVDDAVEAVRGDPASASTHRELAWSFEANGLFDEAARCYANVLALDPDDALSRFHRSMVLAEIGRDAESMAELERARVELPKSPAVQYEWGTRLLEADRPKEARQAFQVVLSELPGAPHGHYGLGRAASRDGAAEIATSYLERALQIAPEHPAIAYALGQAYQATGQPDLAKTYLTRGAGGGELRVPDPYTEEIDKRGRTRDARLERAIKLADLGRFDEAIELLESALHVEPDDETILTNLSSVLIEAERFDRAAEVLERHQMLYPGSYVAFHNLSLLHGATGDLDKSALCASRAAGLAPKRAALRLQYGTALARLGSHAEAYVQFSEATRLGAIEVAVQRELARLSALLGRPNRAADHWRAALQGEPTDPLANLHLVIALGDAGRVDEAREAFAEMHRRVPGHRALAKAEEYLVSKGLR